MLNSSYAEPLYLQTTQKRLQAMVLLHFLLLWELWPVRTIRPAEFGLPV